MIGRCRLLRSEASNGARLVRGAGFLGVNWKMSGFVKEMGPDKNFILKIKMLIVSVLQS
jgi:hypothetical protein